MTRLLLFLCALPGPGYFDINNREFERYCSPVRRTLLFCM